jgi:hypothetical protein
MGKILSCLVGLMALSACANDSYRMASGVPVDGAAMHDAVMSCKYDSIHAYNKDRYGAISGLAMFAGGGLGGVAGGALVGAAAVAGGSENSMTTADMERLTVECMKAKGYEALLDNKP